MSQDRFHRLSMFIRFDDAETRSTRRKKDKLAPIREICDFINNRLGMHYMPGENLTVNERLVMFRGRCPFKQYLPSKPGKYGMKIWWIADSETKYPLGGLPYLGKEGNQRANGLGKKVVEELSRPYRRTNRNITCDNYFTDIDLARNLLKNGLTIVGTVRNNKRFIPKEFLSSKTKEK